ncbi:MAG: hypothetical protein AB7F67_17930 [Rhodospirillaceae bacterium]
MRRAIAAALLAVALSPALAQSTGGGECVAPGRQLSPPPRHFVARTRLQMDELHGLRRPSVKTAQMKN